MSEQMNFTDENKKTVVSFIAGLLIGGLLVYIFALPTSEKAVGNNDSVDESELVADEDESQDENSLEDNESDEEVTRDTPTSSTPVAPVIREGSADVDDQSAGSIVELGDVNFPTDAGWIGVRDYENGKLTGLLGVARFNAVEGLYPTDISLLRSTVAGKTYAVVFYHDNGDKVFNLANDAQIQTEITTFIAR